MKKAIFEKEEMELPDLEEDPYFNELNITDVNSLVEDVVSGKEEEQQLDPATYCPVCTGKLDKKDSCFACKTSAARFRRTICHAQGPEAHKEVLVKACNKNSPTNCRIKKGCNNCTCCRYLLYLEYFGAGGGKYHNLDLTIKTMMRQIKMQTENIIQKNQGNYKNHTDFFIKFW